MVGSFGGLGMGEITVLIIGVLLFLGWRRPPRPPRPPGPPSAAAVVTPREGPESSSTDHNGHAEGNGA